ncbi:hypothetical protein, partial [Staphylococcus aureus]|uniref:hypothetical protein n=1 Tax=Staphylococcus aureus TaxID=1280 RepID=UPI003C6F643C
LRLPSPLPCRKWKDTSNYRIYMFYPTAVLAIQYPVQLTYQHGSATPDTFSWLPATGFLPPLHIQLTFFHPRLTNSQISRHATTGTAKSIRLATS